MYCVTMLIFARQERCWVGNRSLTCSKGSIKPSIILLIFRRVEVYAKPPSTGFGAWSIRHLYVDERFGRNGVSTVAGESTITGEQNPEGDYEDRELVAIHHEVLERIGG